MNINQAVDNAINAHTMWLIRLRKSINQGSSEFKPETVKPDNNCEFGKWFYSELAKTHQNTPIYAEIKNLHARFHKQAAAILELALKGKKKEAEMEMEATSEFKKLSLQLIGKLNTLKQ